MTEQNIISFTDDYDGKGYLTIFERDEQQFEKDKKRIEEKLKKKNLSDEQYNQKLSKELDKVTSLSSKVVKLDKEQEAALINIDALKEEIKLLVSAWGDSSKNIPIELLGIPQSKIDYKVAKNSKLECLKTTLIGKSAAKSLRIQYKIIIYGKSSTTK